MHIQIRECYLRAEECRWLAQNASTSSAKDDFRGR
jgi:hypothetical protein